MKMSIKTSRVTFRVATTVLGILLLGILFQIGRVYGRMEEMKSTRYQTIDEHDALHPFVARPPEPKEPPQVAVLRTALRAELLLKRTHVDFGEYLIEAQKAILETYALFAFFAIAAWFSLCFIPSVYPRSTDGS